MITIKFLKTHPDAQLPSHGREDDAGFDLTAVESVEVPPCGGTAAVSTGLKLADTTSDNKEFFLKIEGRSGLALKGIFPIGGIVDATYRGEIKVILCNPRGHTYWITKGDRIAQLLIYPILAKSESVKIEETGSIIETVRGDSGFGSTGK